MLELSVDYQLLAPIVLDVCVLKFSIYLLGGKYGRSIK